MCLALYSSQSTFSVELQWSLTQSCDVSFIIPSIQIRKTEACISEATCSRLHNKGSKWLGWSQNREGSAPKEWAVLILNPAYLGGLMVAKEKTLASVMCTSGMLSACGEEGRRGTHTLLTTPTPLMQLNLEQRLSSYDGARGWWSRQLHREMPPYSICTPLSTPPVALSNLFNQGLGWSHANLGDVP